MTVREIGRAIRARRDFYVETPGHEWTGRGYYLGGDMLDANEREYSLGGGWQVGRLSVHATFCTCGDWHASLWLELPQREFGVRRRAWAQLWAGERPRAGLQSLGPQRTT